MEPDQRVAGYLGRVLAEWGEPVGTCFQVADGVLVTAWHVLDGLGAGQVDAVVRVDPLQGGPARDARVRRVDPAHDLAVLQTAQPLPACVDGLAATDEVAQRAAVSVTGVSEVPDPGHSYRYLDATGTAEGGTSRDDGVPLARVQASAVVPGMSGAPVLSAGRVVGVVSGRYNSADGWMRDSVWVARTENLAPLLAGLTEVGVRRRVPGDVLDVSLTVEA